MSYTPLIGTLSHRAIEHLKTIGPGKTIATGPLAEALGQPTSAVITALGKPVEHGLVKKERIDGLYHWRMAGSVAPVSSSPAARAEPVLNTVPHVAANGPAVDALARELAPPKLVVPGPAPVPVPEPAPVLVPASAPFKFGWCSDGTLTVSKGGASVDLSADEYGKLADFVAVVRPFMAEGGDA